MDNTENGRHHRYEVPECRWREEEMDFFGTPVPIHLPDTVTLDRLEKFTAFRQWKTTLHKQLELQHKNEEHSFHGHPYSLRKILIKSVDWFGPSGGFVMLNALIERDPLPEDDLPPGSGPEDGGLGGRPAPLPIPRTLPGLVLLRGGSVAMLMILRPKDARDERYVVLTEQPRVPAGSLAFLEIPAGMIDDEGNFSSAAAKEIRQETGFSVPRDDVIDMTELAYANASEELSSAATGLGLQSAMYPSPGGCDEFIALFLWEKELDRQEIEDLRGRLTGERAANEMIKVHVREYEDLWKKGARDGKTLAAWALYEGLNRSGQLDDYRNRTLTRFASTVSSPPLSAGHAARRLRPL